MGERQGVAAEGLPVHLHLAGDGGVTKFAGREEISQSIVDGVGGAGSIAAWRVMSEKFFECSVLFTTILFAAEGDDGESCRWPEDAAELR